MVNELRLWIAEILLGWIITIAPDTADGNKILVLIYAYFKNKVYGNRD